MYDKNIRYGRILHGMTQQRLGEAIGVKKTTVSNWESGVAKPDLETVIKLAQLFKFSLDDFLLKDLKAEGFKEGVSPVQDNWTFRKNKNLLVPSKAVRNYIDKTDLKGVDTYYIYLPLLDKEGDYRTFEITSDSMAPVLMFGDWVGCESVEDVQDLTMGSIYAVLSKSGSSHFCYAQSFGQGLSISTIDSEFQSVLIPYDDIHEVWLAKCRLSKHFNKTFNPV